MRTRLAAVLVALLPAAFAHAAPDHWKLDALQREFQSGPEVTQACLACHRDAAKEVHKTQHWNWEYVSPDTGQRLGKRHVVNNFCTSSATNLSACASCHIGYGRLKEGRLDLAGEDNVDCLVCHDTTGRYKKPSGLAGNVVVKDTELPTGSGRIVKGLNLATIAQHVGKTSRNSCGACHFYGGGGDGVKHGDMDSSLEAPERTVDVHMDAKGLNFSCTTCHKTQNHAVPGSRYGPMGVGPTCDGCHGGEPHKENVVLNGHTAKLACQTCHIPFYARGGVPTKMAWDWSTAAQRDADGKPFVKRNKEGYEVYTSLKGDFELAEKVQPDYLWFNGKIRYTLPTDPIDASKGPVWINRFEGSPGDGKSKIWPVKIFRAKQPWDPVNGTLAITHLAGNDESAFWKNLDWTKAVAAGMAHVGMPFSGKVAFIETFSTWPITHMVAPKGEALGCADCHSPKGRLARVPGVSPGSINVGSTQ